MKKKLTDFEWTLIWMSIRYAMNRQTIASATLPEQIIKNYYKYLTDQQKQSIIKDLKENFEEYGKFGDERVDNPIWLKFWYSLDKTKQFKVTDIEDKEHIVFRVNDKLYPLEQYLKEPHTEIYLPIENIKI